MMYTYLTVPINKLVNTGNNKNTNIQKLKCNIIIHLIYKGKLRLLYYQPLIVLKPFETITKIQT